MGPGDPSPQFFASGHIANFAVASRTGHQLLLSLAGDQGSHGADSLCSWSLCLGLTDMSYDTAMCQVPVKQCPCLGT